MPVSPTGSPQTDKTDPEGTREHCEARLLDGHTCPQQGVVRDIQTGEWRCLFHSQTTESVN